MNERFFQLVGEAMFEVCSKPKYGALRNLGKLSVEEEEQHAYMLASKAIEIATERYKKEKRLAEVLELEL